MTRTQIKSLNKKVDELIKLKRLPTPEEIGISMKLIKKYGINYTTDLRGLTDKDLDLMIEVESKR